MDCEQGRLGSHAPCSAKRRTRDGATFTGTDISFEGAFTVRLTWPDTVVAVNKTESSLDAGDAGYALLAGPAGAIAAAGNTCSRRRRPSCGRRSARISRARRPRPTT